MSEPQTSSTTTRQSISVLALGILISACHASPIAPTPTPEPVVRVPALITIAIGGPTSLSQSVLTFHVRDANGHGVSGATLMLTTTAGTLTPSTVTSGPQGQAQSLLQTTTNANVTATTDSVSATILAPAYRIVLPPEPPIFRPPPAPPAPPPPSPTPDPPPTLQVSLSCTPEASPTPTPCNVTVSYDGATVPSADITRVDWDWGDGQSETPPLVNPEQPYRTHTYTVPGTYTVIATATATTSDGSKTATTSKALSIP